MRGSRHLRHEPEQNRSRVLLKFIHLHHCGLFDDIYAGKLNEPSVHVTAFASLTRSSAWTASSGEAQSPFTKQNPHYLPLQRPNTNTLSTRSSGQSFISIKRREREVILKSGQQHERKTQGKPMCWHNEIPANPRKVPKTHANSFRVQTGLISHAKMP